MRTQDILTLIAALSLGLVSCNKEIEAPEMADGNYFIAEVPSTKITLESNYSLTWNVGDAVAVYDGTQTYTFNATTAGAKTNLVNSEVSIDPVKTYKAVYPLEGSTFVNEDSLVVIIPVEQNFTGNSFKYSYGVATCSGADRKFEFKNVASLVAFEITESDIVKVAIQGRNSEVLAGKVAVNCADASYKVVEDGEKEVILSSPSPLSTGRHYAAILPQNYKNGIVVTLTKANGSNTVRRTKGFELTRSSYIDLEKLDESRKWAHYITNAKELQTFLDDAPSFDTEHIAMLGCDIDLTDVTLNSAASYSGTFDGAGFSIKNLTTQTPLFEELSEGAVVKNLNFDNCYYIVYTVRNYDALLCGVNEGLVMGCNVKKNSKVATPSGASAIATDKSIAGLVALNRNTGAVLNCTNSARIGIYSKAYLGSNDNTKQVWVAGVVAQTAPTYTDSSSVRGCTNSGYVIYHGVRTKAPVYVGGVLGGSPACLGTEEYADDLDNWGTISDCTNTGTVKFQMDDLSGTSDKMNCYNLGGVIGYWEGSVLNCNSSEGSNVIFESALEGNKTYRCGRVAMGGIAGYVSKSLTNCTNNSSVSVTGRIGRSDLAKLSIGSGSTWRDSMCGGVVGFAGNNNGATITSCINNGKISFNMNQAAGDATANISMGGVIGVAKAAVTSCSNSGDIEGQSDIHFHYIGGVIGRSTLAVTNCTNSGDITFDNLTSEGTSTDFRSWQSFVGGISAYHAVASCTTAIEKCFNTGNITFKNGVGARVDSKGQASTPIQMIGGITGLATGKIIGDQSNRTANTGNISVLGSVRVYAGGIIAYANATVSYCDNTGNVTATGVENTGISNGSMIAGLAGVVFASYKCSINAETSAAHGQLDKNGIELVGSNYGNVTGAQLSETQSGFGLITGKINVNTDADGNFYWYDSTVSGDLNVSGDQTKVGFISAGGILCTKVCLGKETAPCTINNLKLNSNPVTTMEEFKAHLGFDAASGDFTNISFAK